MSEKEKSSCCGEGFSFSEFFFRQDFIYCRQVAEKPHASSVICLTLNFGFMSEVGKECRKSARPKYINPMIDGGFKILFGSERSKELTESLLSAILGFEVAEVTFLNTEALPAALDEKPVRYDILCEDREGGRYLLEMQVKGHPGLLERTFYYMGRMLSSQLGAGEDYTRLK